MGERPRGADWLRTFGRWAIQWYPLDVLLVLTYTGLLIIVHGHLDAPLMRGLVLMIEGIIGLGMVLQGYVWRAIPAVGEHWWQRSLYRLSGLMIPLCDAVGWIIYTEHHL